MTEREALKLALEALENTTPTGFNMERDKQFFAAIAAIKEALAQPEQEPVARYFENYQGQPTEEIDEERFNQTPEECRFKLYTAPPQRTWVGLTDDDLIECERLAGIRHRKHMGSIRGQQLSPADQFLWHYARSIEAKLKEKNT